MNFLTVFIILLIFINVTLPYYNDNSNGEHCSNTYDNDPSSSYKDKTNGQYSPYNFYQPRPRYETYKWSNNNNKYETNKRRINNDYDDDDTVNNIQKRQVGVVYGNGKPIGILQLHQQSYKFIPVKEYSVSSSNEVSYIDKRDTNDLDSKLNRKRYPHQKRHIKNYEERVERSATNYNNINKQIEEKLTNIVNDMGLKDEMDKDNDNDRSKRDNQLKSTPSIINDKKLDENVEKNERKKREKDLLENSNNSKNQVSSENSIIQTRESDNTNNNDNNNNNNNNNNEEDESIYEKRIKNKIDALQEAVKREIDVINNENEDDSQREKRQTNLTDRELKENDELDPVKNTIDVNMKSLVRRKRTAALEETDDSDKIDEDEDADESSDSDEKIKKIKKKHQEKISKSRDRRQQNPDEFDNTNIFVDNNDNDDNAIKRDINNDNENNDQRNKRSEVQQMINDDDYYYYVDSNDRFKRQNYEYFDLVPMISNRFRYRQSYPVRFRRRVQEPGIERMERPRQLNDMSGVDLFGALSKGYNGELTRLKRVKRH